MSTSVYPVVGRVRRDIEHKPQLAHRVDEQMPSVPDLNVVATPSAWIGAKELKPSDFEFMRPNDDYPDQSGNVMANIYDNYPLFSWLADARGLCQPRSDGEARKDATKDFIDWIGNTSGVSYLDLDCSKSPNETMHEYYFEGFGNSILYTIDDLFTFNYDTVAYVAADSGYRPHPELKTWRELFSEAGGYFEFIAEAKAKGWEFVIFCFD